MDLFPNHTAITRSNHFPACIANLKQEVVNSNMFKFSKLFIKYLRKFGFKTSQTAGLALPGDVIQASQRSVALNTAKMSHVEILFLSQGVFGGKNKLWMRLIYVCFSWTYIFMSEHLPHHKHCIWEC